jgi:hypothetical protein
MKASKISHNFALDVAHKMTQSRKRVKEGLGKGFERICKSQEAGISLAAAAGGAR